MIKLGIKRGDGGRTKIISNENMKNIEPILRELRKITIAKLERECDMGNGTVRGWKASSPSVENLKKVADYFNITVDELITTDGRKRREE